MKRKIIQLLEKLLTENANFVLNKNKKVKRI
ncbi:hypothetical protein BH10ACI1_BH10ACI1_11620 [soil metagenome]